MSPHTRYNSPLMAEIEVSRAREFIQYTHSNDPKVAAAVIVVRTGKKWIEGSELSIAEERLMQKTL